VKRKVQVLLQSGMIECAHACLAMIANYHGHQWTVEKIRSVFATSSRGTSVSQLSTMAQEIGFDTRIYRAEPSHLGRMRLPCVLHWDLSHFVVLETLANGQYEILDPAGGRMVMGQEELSKRFTGIVVEISPGLKFNERKIAPDTTALKMIWNGFWAYRSTVAWSALLAVVLECIGLISPIFIQKATDLVLPANDGRLLLLLTLAFVAAVLLQGGIAMIRSSILIQLGERLTVQWNGAVAAKLLRLPYLFFMQRSMSDINSRFGSILEIQRVVTHRFIEGLLDGLTSAIGLVILVTYSPWLALLTVAMSGLYASLRLGTNQALVSATERSIRMQSGQQGALLEILHGIHSVKASGSEATMLARYGGKTVDAAISTRRVQWLSSVVGEGGQTILRLHWVLVVAAGSFLAMRGHFTAGMLVAYITYATQFSMRSTRLLDLLAEWRLLKLHGSRLSDIVASKEAEQSGSSLELADHFDIVVRDVRFRYDREGPWILNGATLHVASGECVAIKGPSGTGKSTLAKVLVGLVDADSGSVSIGGREGSELRRSMLLEHVACVMQDDQLFSGTIAENVAMFQPGFSKQKVMDACRLAQVHEEIIRMPLRYDTRLIDLGASLSGGQKQRIMLARALYRDPKILVLDEASSHLDLENERLINQAISALKITRIIVAHRQETLSIADRVVELRDGKLEGNYGPEESRQRHSKVAAASLAS
jgi:ATP-binding cassette subfamily B protein RaxB